VCGFLGLFRVLRNLGEAGLVRGKGIADADHNGMASYAEALQAKVAHAPVEPSRSEKEEIASRVAKNDMVEPELVAAVTNMGRHATFHPTMAVPGEQLPEGFVRSGFGFLVCTTPQEVQVNQSIVKRDIEHLQKHAVLAYFVGGRHRSMTMSQWVFALQAEVGAWVGIGRDLGKGFFQIYTKSLITTQKILMLTPHRSKWGTCILQTWTSDFTSSKPTGLKVPTWVTLKEVPGESLGVAAEIATGLRN
jgi:hypothetical protein